MLKKIANSTLIKHGGIYTISNVVNASIPFLLLPVLTRYLSKSDYGIIATFQYLIAFFIPIIGLNTQASVIRRQYDTEKIDFAKYVTTCIVILLVNTLLLIVLLIPLSPFISDIAEFPSTWFWTIITVTFFQYLFTLVLGIWQANGKIYRYASFQNFQTALNFFASLLLIISFQMNWQGRVLAQTVSMVVFGALALLMLYKMGFLKGQISKKYFIDALKFALPLIPYSFSGWVLYTMDRIFINNMIGLDETGLYSVAFQISMIINLLQLSFNTAWVPWFYKQVRKNEASLNLKIVKFTYAFIIANFLFAFLLILAAPLFFKFFLGKDFYQAGDYLWWLALAQAASAIHVITVSYINLHNKNIYLTYSAIFIAVVHIPLTYYLLKMNGTIGAAQSLFISNMTASLITFFVAQHLHKMPWHLKSAKTID
jgi:O-antigen/teichoic acid export membrane protein